LSYNIPGPPRQFAIVFDAIPSGAIMHFRFTGKLPSTSVSLDVAESPVGKICFFSQLPQNNNAQIFVKMIIVSG